MGARYGTAISAVPAKRPMSVRRTIFVRTRRPSICIINAGAIQIGNAASSPPKRAFERARVKMSGVLGRTRCVTR